jgi:hypothetical protein
VQQVRVGGLKAARLEALDRCAGTGHRRVGRVLLPKQRHGLQRILNLLCRGVHTNPEFI